VAFFLTNRNAFVTFSFVFVARVNEPHKVRRFLSAAVLLFVFFLPLHLHFSATPQISKECSCAQGTRTHLAPAAEISTRTPTFQAARLIFQDAVLLTDEWTSLQNVRGPPSLLAS
jgi:hypothetical protein